MRLLDLPIRLLLVATFGLLPLLCCCGTAKAEVADAQPAEHSCCATGDETAGEPTPAPAEHDCDCDRHIEAMQRQAEAEPAAATGGFVVLPPLPLPPALASVLFDLVPAATPPPSVLDAAAVPAAPTLRALSVLLLT